MSGKGKQGKKASVVKSTRDSGKLAQASLANSDTSSEGSEMMATLPVLKVIDNNKFLPRYTSILQRTFDEGINMEDLDFLQPELEMILTSVVVRSRILKEEISNLSSAEERRDKRSKSGKGLSLLDKKWRDDKLKSKDGSQKPHLATPGKILKQRTGNLNHLVPNPHEIVRVEASKTDNTKLLLPKNDTLNKFWASIDPYCSDIMPDDIKLLEELITTHGDLGPYKKIPPLGRHYTLAWAQNDLMQEEEAGILSKDKKKSKADLALPKVEKKSNGPLTQRLVCALLEENVYAGNNNTDSKPLFRDGDPPVLRDLSIQNSMNLESRVHKELIEQGLIDPEAKKNPDDDEILAEIRRCQQELFALSNHNVTQLKRLLHLAQEESKRQAIKRKIATIDKEIVEQYEKLLAAKQRKTPLSKKEQEKSWACLKERESLLEQLNMLPSNSIGEPVRSTTANQAAT